jgi:hypothetical protein
MTVLGLAREFLRMCAAERHATSFVCREFSILNAESGVAHLRVVEYEIAHENEVKARALCFPRRLKSIQQALRPGTPLKSLGC